MREADTTHEQLIADNAALRRRLAELESVITAHTGAEEALRASERRYRHLMEHSLGLLCIHDLDGVLLEVNTAAARALGYHPTEGVGKSLRTFLAPAVQHRFDAYLERIRRQPSDSGLLRVVTRTGEERVWLYRNIRYEEPDAAPYVLGHALDITERVQAEQALKQAHEELEQRVAERTTALQRINTQLHAEIAERQRVEEELHRSEALFRSLVQNASDIVALFTIDGKVRYYSPALERVLGYRPDDLIGRHVFGAIHPEDVAPVQAAIAWLAQHPGVTRDIELRLRHQDGTWHTFEVVGNCPLDEHSAGCIVVNARDITERKRVEAALRDSEMRYRTLVEGSIQGISVIDRQGIRVFANTRLAQIFGYDDPHELLGKPARERIAPHEHARLRQAYLARLRGEALQTRFTYQGLRRDGTPIWLENVVSLIVWDGQPAQLTTLVDVTERQAAEEARQRLEAQLDQTQKLEALGTLAGGVAHEFNNMLGVILGFAELTQYEVSHGSGAWENLQQILVAGQRAKDIVQQLLTFSRPSDQVREPLVLAVVVQEVLTLLRATLPTTITIEPRISAEPVTVLANRTQLYQVVMTLCSNAEYAMRETGGTLTIEVAPVEVTAATQHAALHPGPYVRLSIRDSGPGMSRDVLERIFDPFFTTKGVGEGTGMGLAISHSIVTSHGGAIFVESSPGAGATFDIYLPRIATVLVETSTAPAEDLPRGTARILFVDDEAMLAQIGHGLLAQQGYTVVGYTSSQETLAAFQATPHAFDLVITDQTMPEMTGEALARTLRQIRPDIPIILCTGFSHVMNAEKAQALGIDAFLMKPFGVRELVVAIQQVLTQRAGETA